MKLRNTFSISLFQDLSSSALFLSQKSSLHHLFLAHMLPSWLRVQPANFKTMIIQICTEILQGSSELESNMSIGLKLLHKNSIIYDKFFVSILIFPTYFCSESHIHVLVQSTILFEWQPHSQTHTSRSWFLVNSMCTTSVNSATFLLNLNCNAASFIGSEHPWNPGKS
jgi:hypothetical protein